MPRNTLRLLILPGDGIGPEIVGATRSVVEALDQQLDLGLDLVQSDIGLTTLQSDGTSLPDGVLEEARNAHGVILGPVSTNDYPPADAGGINPSATLRIQLDLYANVRPSRSRPSVPAVSRNMDLVIVRENTEGFYADRNMFVGSGEFQPTPDLALSVRKISAAGSERIARTAFELAMRRRKHVTAVHKANVLRISDGLFLREVRAVAKEFPDVRLDEVIVDAMAALLVRDASPYDVIVTTNMFGDILTDEAAELSGGLGLAGSINAGDQHAIAQAQHGSAPDIAGKGIANPASLMLSVAMLFDWLANRHGRDDLATAAARLERAVDAALDVPANHTPDLGGEGSTTDLAGAVQNALTTM